jgi:DNA-binding response OmpR family regulator
MNRLLLVEDDEALALGIEFTLKDEGYEVVTASTIKEGKILFEKEKLDLIILDVNLPDGSGYELCKEIRTTSEVPIIFLTALDEEVNVIVGFEIGGDDYITKPFRVRELLSRIKAVLRRNSKGATNGSNVLVSGDIVINTATATVKKGDKDIILTAQEYKLLLIFMSKANVMMKREEILKELLEGAEVFFDENTLSVYIKRVREKIEDNPKEPQYIITARGLGYKWNKGVIRE